MDDLTGTVAAALEGQLVTLVIRGPEVFVDARGPLGRRDALRLAERAVQVVADNYSQVVMVDGRICAGD